MALKDKLMTLEDFKAVRDVDVASNSAQFTEIKADLDAKGLNNDIKAALINVVSHIGAWTDGHRQDYVDALENALYGVNIASISATLNNNAPTFYNIDELEVLRQYLTVTALYENGTSEVVTSYTLSGTMVAGTNSITVTYRDKTTNVSVSVADWYNVTSRSISNGLIKITSDGLSGWGCSDGHGNKNTGQPFAGVASASYPRNRLYTDKGKTPAWADENWAENHLYADGVYLIPVPSNKRTVTITGNPSNDVYYALTSYGYDDTTEQYGDRIEDSRWVASGNSYTLNSGAKYIAPLVKYTSGGREQLPNFTDVTIVFS